MNLFARLEDVLQYSQRKIKVFRGIYVSNDLGVQRRHDLFKHFLVAGERSAEAFIDLSEGKVIVAGMRFVIMYNKLRKLKRAKKKT